MNDATAGPPASSAAIPVGDDDLHAFMDGQLPPERAAIVADYLLAHPDIDQRFLRYREQRDALRAELQRKYDEPIPTRLRIATLTARRRTRRLALLSRAVAALLLLAVGGGAGWGAGWYARDQTGSPFPTAHDPAGRDLTGAALAAFRTFTVEQRHPVEVRADEQPHLVQWLSNRLNQTIRVPDLSRRGFRLMGGRVLPTAGGIAALLMYDDDQGTRLTVYLRPTAPARPDATQAGDPLASELRDQDSDGIRTFYQAQPDLAFAVTARTARDRLRDVAQDVAAQMGSGQMGSAQPAPAAPPARPAGDRQPI